MLPGATVTIRNVATGLTRTAATDEGGRYVFSALPPEGRYEITVELPASRPQLRNNLAFNAGQRAVLNVPMKLSNIQETITVAGESPLVQTTSSEVSSTIDRRRLRDPAGARSATTSACCRSTPTSCRAGPAPTR